LPERVQGKELFMQT